MKKICFIDFDFTILGGLERVLTSVANELCKDLEVHVLSLNNSKKKPYFNLDERVFYKALTNGDYRIRELMMKCFNPLKQYFHDNKIDIAFLMGNYAPPVVLPIKLFTKTKLVFCDHGALENQLENKKVMLFRKMAAKHCNMVITLTERSAVAYRKIFKLPKEKVDFIYNWIDPNAIKGEPEYKIDSKLLLSVGRIDEEKGYDLVAPIGKHIFHKHPDWKWHIYGDGEKFDEVKKQIEDFGLTQKIILMGSVKNVYELYKNYSICVLTSYREGLPLALLEAKGNKLPLVSFDIISGPDEIIKDNEDGYLIEPYDTKKMAAKICDLIENPEKRTLFSENSVKNIQKFEMKNIVDKWEFLIDNL